MRKLSKTYQAGRARAYGIYGKGACRICGEKGEIHHIDGNSHNNLPENIDRLCHPHHMEVHDKGEFLARIANVGGKANIKKCKRGSDGRFSKRMDEAQTGI